MTPEGWALMTAVAVAVIGGATSVRGAAITRRAQREAAAAQVDIQREAVRTAPYEAMAKRVESLESQVPKLEGRVETLEAELRTERARSAHAAAAFRGRIQVLLRYIASLDEYAEVLVNIIREKRIELVSMPRKPELPPDAADEL